MAGLSLASRTALVTGATRGIGHAIALKLAARGCRVFASGRDRDALAALAAGQPGISLLPCDLLQPTEIKAMAASIEEKAGRLDFLINNAGIAHANQAVSEMSFESWRKVYATNLDAMFLVTQAVLPLMSTGGVIVNNISVAAQIPFAGASAYCSSKAAALMFTNVLREELRARGIRVTALMPGAIHTEIWNQFWADAPRDRMATADDVAHLVAAVLELPASATSETIHIGPVGGEL
ncbi:MAG: SDR family oxidoreductase [Acidobacteriales bacterium]|nr:SDR family oxidoreductase [Terriglobales bacterium]